MDLTDDDWRRIANELGTDVATLQSEAVKDCAESVKNANPEMSKSQAFAICQDMENDGLLADGAATVLTLAEVRAPDAIERTEQADGSVRYANVLLLAPGIWTDAASEQRVWYSPAGIEASADNWTDNTLNLLHAQEDETLEVGHVDVDSVYVDDQRNLYGDLVLHRNSAASELADESLQAALESEGAAGIDGPSVELRGVEYDWSSEHNAHELVRGEFQGVGLVGLGITAGPASKPADFSRQIADRAVALAESDSNSEGDDGSTPTVYTPQYDMNIDKHTLAEQLPGVDPDDLNDDQLEAALQAATDATVQLQDDAGDGDGDDADTGTEAREIISDLEEAGMDLEQIADVIDRDPSTVGDIANGDIEDPPAEVLEALREHAEEMRANGELATHDNKPDDDGDGSDDDSDDSGDDTDDDEDMPAMGELREQLDALEDRLASLEDETEQLRTSDTSLSDLVDMVESLAEAETVDAVEQELADVESRLAAIEEEPEPPATLADGTEAADERPADRPAVRLGRVTDRYTT